MNLSIGHLLIILAIVVLVMGPSRLEGVGSGLGKAIRGFKKGLEGDDEDTKKKDSPKDKSE
jgi:sec-independent protein translocase protein TatA